MICWFASWVSRVKEKLRRDKKIGDYLQKALTGSLLIQGAAIILTFLGNLLLARWMGAEEFGKYTFVLAWLAVAANLFSLGLDDFAMSELPASLVEKDTEKKNRLLKYIWKKSILFIILGTVSSFLINHFFQQTDPEHLYNYYLPAVVALPFSVLVLNVQGMLRGGQHVLSGQLPEKVIRPAAIIILAALTYYLTETEENKGIRYLWATSTGIALAFFSGLYLFRKKNRFDFLKTRLLLPEIRKWNHSLYYFFLLSLLGILHTRIDVLLLGSMGYLEYTGIYNTASRIVDLPLILMVIVHTVIAPLFSKLKAENRMDALQRIYTTATQVIFFSALPVFLLLLIFREPALMIFGKPFVQGQQVIIILSIAQLIQMWIGPAAYLLMMLGHGKMVTKILTVSFAITMVNQVMLIPKWGLEGAALGRGLGMLIGAAAYVYYLRKLEKIKAGAI